jgi:hypothetical protein
MKRLDQLFQPLPVVYSYSVDPYMVLGFTLVFLALLCALGFGLPLLAVRRRSPPPSSSLIFFAAIGLGYLSMEIVLIQFFVLFLGFPTYALTVVLFSLLLFTGIGALIAPRWRRSRRALLTNLASLCVLLVASAFWLEAWLRSMISLPFASRVAVSVGLLAPLGLTAGAAMPIGLKRFAADHPTSVAWAWGINGIASVLGAAVAVFLAITWGYSLAAIAAACCYLIALGHTAASGRHSYRRSLRQVEEPAPLLKADTELVGHL